MAASSWEWQRKDWGLTDTAGVAILVRDVSAKARALYLHRKHLPQPDG